MARFGLSRLAQFSRRIKMAVFIELFDKSFDWSKLKGEDNPEAKKVLPYVHEILTAYGREGIQNESGIIYSPDDYIKNQQEMDEFRFALAHEFISKGLAKEAVGFITPDMTPNWFDQGPKYIGTKEMQPDTTYTDWMSQTRMVMDVEERREWDFTAEFVRMDKAGKVKYGEFADAVAYMYNYEYGSGVQIFTSWFEMNLFGVKMGRLAPKFRYAFFNMIADMIYTAGVAAWTTAISVTTQNIIRDLNTACDELRRYTNTLNQTPFENASFRIISAPENRWYLDAALAMSYALMSRERVQQRMPVTYTAKLDATSAVYVIVDNWEKNELGTRVPFSVYGSTKDIDTFSEKTSYRGAFGINVDPVCARKIQFDPADSDFVIGGPFATKDFTGT
jgi:hypothetical protein